jgi:cytoskeletal protein CcmA (bactofilin family)
LQVVGNVDISGDLSVDGESHYIGGPLLLNGDLDTIGTVSVGGEMTIADDLNTQDVYINGKKF